MLTPHNQEKRHSSKQLSRNAKDIQVTTGKNTRPNTDCFEILAQADSYTDYTIRHESVSSILDVAHSNRMGVAFAAVSAVSAPTKAHIPVMLLHQPSSIQFYPIMWTHCSILTTRALSNKRLKLVLSH